MFEYTLITTRGFGKGQQREIFFVSVEEVECQGWDYRH